MSKIKYNALHLVRAGIIATALAAAPGGRAQEQAPEQPQDQDWNAHIQNTDIGQGDTGFPAKYSGQHSLKSKGEIKETVSLDFFGGVRLWDGAELHADGLLWQGYGLSHTFGIVAFPNGDAYKAGTQTPNLMFSHLFLRQIIGLGGEQEQIADDQFNLASTQDISRLTLTFGRMSYLDVFDQNSYAHDPHTQFMNWALMGNLAWDYGQDTVGYGTGFTAELNQPGWALRYGFFMMPQYQNAGNAGSGDGGEDEFLTWPARGHFAPFTKSWSMATEAEKRWSIDDHPGALRLLAWLNEANMDTYRAATAILLANGPDADISSAQAYRYAHGFGLNWEQELAQGIGVFSRLGWNDGNTQALEFSDANWTTSLGVSVKGGAWDRPDDTFGLAGVISGISADNRKFLAAGGLGIEDGDGNLTYGNERVLETYYDFRIIQGVHGAFDYQYIVNPAFNRDRGPVSVFAVRLHSEF